MNVPVEADGALGIVDGISAPGLAVDAARRDGRAGPRLELPPDQQPLQRLQPDAGADDVSTPGDRRSHPCLRHPLVANRGEIARRIIAPSVGSGCGRSPCSPTPTAAAPHVRAGRRGRADRARRRPGATPYPRADLRPPGDWPPSAYPPGLRLPLRERGLRPAQCGGRGSSSSDRPPTRSPRFGEKHTARALADAAGVPLLAGTELLPNVDEAVRRGGRDRLPRHGQGHRRRRRDRHAGLRHRRRGERPRSPVSRLAERTSPSPEFSWSGSCGPPDTSRCRSSATAPDGSSCSATATARCRRRNQKVIEEAPAPACPTRCATPAHARAEPLRVGGLPLARAPSSSSTTRPRGRRRSSRSTPGCRSNTRSPRKSSASTSSQWMLTLARGTAGSSEMFGRRWEPDGFAVEARIYAEDPDKESLPSSGPSPGLNSPGSDYPIPGVRVDWLRRNRAGGLTVLRSDAGQGHRARPDPR